MTTRFFLLAALGIGVLWVADVQFHAATTTKAWAISTSEPSTLGRATPRQVRPPSPVADIQKLGGDVPELEKPAACSIDLVAPPADFYLDEGDTRPDLPGYQRDVVLKVSPGCVGRRIEFAANTGESRDYTFDAPGRHTFRDFTMVRTVRPGEKVASRLQVSYSDTVTPLDVPAAPVATIERRRDGRFMGTCAASPGVASYRAHGSATSGGAALFTLCATAAGGLTEDIPPGHRVLLTPCRCVDGRCLAVEVP